MPFTFLHSTPMPVGANRCSPCVLDNNLRPTPTACAAKVQVL